ncbi:MAG: DUF1707 SHOCT-like domain-containing protein [Trebonia sp.]
MTPATTPAQIHPSATSVPSVGRLTLDELEDRSSRALTAKTRGELDALTSDLPRAGAPAQPEAQPRRRARWLVSILGSAIHAGRSRAVSAINAISILGSGEIDLRNAEIEGDELTINSFALLGGPDIVLPDTVPMDRSALADLWDRTGPSDRTDRWDPGARSADSAAGEGAADRSATNPTKTKPAKTKPARTKPARTKPASGQPRA